MDSGMAACSNDFGFCVGICVVNGVDNGVDGVVVVVVVDSWMVVVAGRGVTTGIMG